MNVWKALLLSSLVVLPLCPALAQTASIYTTTAPQGAYQATNIGYDTQKEGLVFGSLGNQIGYWDTNGFNIFGDASFQRVVPGGSQLHIQTPLSGAEIWAADPTGTIAQLLLLNPTGGDVGIATLMPYAQLDVGGGIRTGFDSDMCSSTNEGTQRYDVSIHNYEFCNGTSWQLLGSNDPSGEIAYFNLSACPFGWNPADSTNGTLDLRGEFIRGLDDGRGVDPNRTLGSWEPATGIGFWVSQAANIQSQNDDSLSAPGANTSRAGLNGYVDGQQYFTVRPRNVALLACQKI